MLQSFCSSVQPRAVLFVYFFKSMTLILVQKIGPVIKHNLALDKYKEYESLPCECLASYLPLLTISIYKVCSHNV